MQLVKSYFGMLSAFAMMLWFKRSTPLFHERNVILGALLFLLVYSLLLTILSLSIMHIATPFHPLGGVGCGENCMKPA